MKPVRRIIIGQNSDHQSSILEDSHAENIDHFITGVDEAVSINLWATRETPPNLNQTIDPVKPSLGSPFLPSKNGTIFRICDIPPDANYLHRLDDILLNNEKISAEQKALKHPLMHQVDALIYAIVLEGEVTLILDNIKTKLNPGDVVIDCGSHHAWSNETGRVCRMAFVLIDAVRK